MATPTLEERVAALEDKIKQMEHRQEADKSADATCGWQRFVGVFQNDPEFEEAVRFGREWREAQRPADYEAIPSRYVQ